ncbi:hypothetical protein CQA38_08440 [Campylobacter sp. MIT 12-5580]|uniref:replication/maintenance protein RepL n=1 Tax=Campylobacter sp. MIT 12-5580 TaxID=2040651 RepID=UPI00113BBDCE|nr:replication/maintenance protein RepL [Campylobacter sp. MIT 12-5580]TKX28265.1 hypothetical protein CQA38_08440 [Campylobacter sp. MIT 12-5580]
MITATTYKYIGERDFNFMKMFDKFLEVAIKPFMPEKTFNVLNFIILNADENNCIFSTAEMISKYCNTTLLTTQKILRELIKTGFIKKIQNGVYQINADILFRGSAKKRQLVKQKFEEKPKYTLAEKKEETKKTKQKARRQARLALSRSQQQHINT